LSDSFRNLNPEALTNFNRSWHASLRWTAGAAQVSCSRWGREAKANDKVARAVNRPVGFEEPG